MAVRQALLRSDGDAVAGVGAAESARVAILHGTGALIGPCAITRLLVTKTNAGGGDAIFRLYNAAAGGIEIVQSTLTSLTGTGEWDAVSFNPPLTLLAEEPLNYTAFHAGGGAQNYTAYVEAVSTARA